MYHSNKLRIIRAVINKKCHVLVFLCVYST